MAHGERKIDPCRNAVAPLLMAWHLNVQMPDCETPYVHDAKQVVDSLRQCLQ
jgi:hypothetical protein